MDNTKNNTGIYVFVGVILLLVVLVIGVISLTTLTPPDDASKTYFCNYKNLSLSMKVDVYEDNNLLYKIDGEYLSKFEDNLMMVDKNNNVILKSIDDYNLISQNDHYIMKDDDDIQYKCDGKISVVSNSYSILDKQDNVIATVKFYPFDTYGKLLDSSGNIIAEYKSNLFRKDYYVSIYNSDTIDPESILMIFASYVSDFRSDNS